MACFSNKSPALRLFSDASCCAVLALDNCARSSTSLTLNKTWPLDTLEPSSKWMLSTTPETSERMSISSLASKVPDNERLSEKDCGFKIEPSTIDIDTPLLIYATDEIAVSWPHRVELSGA